MGAEKTLQRPNVSWLIEHGLTENFDGINPNFRALFEIFWNHGYTAYTLNPSREVTGADVNRWLAQEKRDFGGIDFLFQRAKS